MTQPYQFRDDYSLLPPWLTEGTAEKFEYAMRLYFDLLMEKANEAIRFRLPGQGDPSQLPYLAYDRALVQGPAESNAAFATRLQGAFAAWGLAGSSRAVLAALQAYLQDLQPGVPAANTLATIVRYGTTLASWSQLYQGSAIGALPTLTHVAPANFRWDSQARPWRAWLILPMTFVAVGLSGSHAQTGTTFGGSFTSPGQNVNGVWVPTTSGTPVNAPFCHVINLVGMTQNQIGQWLTVSGSGQAGNNGTFQIVEVVSSSRVVIANTGGVASDAGPLTWSVSAYPFIGPGLPWGTPGMVWGQGELSPPAATLGQNVGGVWVPSVTQIPGSGALGSWGLGGVSSAANPFAMLSPNTLISIRGLVSQWKSAETYYPHFVVTFDGAGGAAGSAYSPNSIEGSGNPDGSFGSVGHNVSGVWVPTRLVTSPFDCYVQGTGRAQNCAVENIT
jgi:hypothetical protein